MHRSAYPPAPDRLERAAERIIATGLSPEEYAGYYGENILAFALHRYLYGKPAVSAYIKRLGEILDTPTLLADCQQLHKKPDAPSRAKAEGGMRISKTSGRTWRRRRATRSSDN